MGSYSEYHAGANKPTTLVIALKRLAAAHVLLNLLMLLTLFATRRLLLPLSMLLLFWGLKSLAAVAACDACWQVEHGFKHLLDEFHPQAKFWGTKILVSAPTELLLPAHRLL